MLVYQRVYHSRYGQLQEITPSREGPVRRFFGGCRGKCQSLSHLPMRCLAPQVIMGLLFSCPCSGGYLYIYICIDIGMCKDMCIYICIYIYIYITLCNIKIPTCSITVVIGIGNVYDLVQHMCWFPWTHAVPFWWRHPAGQWMVPTVS